jgi:hypothetical protein
MKMTPFFAMHGHFGAERGFLLLLVVVVAAFLIVMWPGRNETK